MAEQLAEQLTKLQQRESELQSKSPTAREVTFVWRAVAEKIQKYSLVNQEFNKFIETTERSHEKIEESVVTLLYVVKKESDGIFRKKASIANQ